MAAGTHSEYWQNEGSWSNEALFVSRGMGWALLGTALFSRRRVRSTNVQAVVQSAVWAGEMRCLLEM